MNKILNYLFNIDSFIFVEPENRCCIFSKKNIFKNIIYYSREKKIKKLFKNFFFLIRIILLNVLQILYLPIIIFFYFSKFRFPRINSNQIGVMAHHIDAMIKYTILEKKKPIIIIPKFSKYETTFRYLLNDKFIYSNNNFIYILSLPLLFFDKISIGPEYVETFFDDEKIINKNFYNKILLNCRRKRKYKNFCKFSKNRNKYLKNIFKKNFKDINLKKTIVIHTRDKSFYPTSHLRTSKFKSYLKTIKYILGKKFFIIRIVNKKQKSNFKHRKYCEFFYEKFKDKDLQLFIIQNSYAMISNHGGLSSVGAMLDIPLYQTNVMPYDHSHANKLTDSVLFKKVFKNKKLLNIKEINAQKDIKYGTFSIVKKKNINIQDNSENEICTFFKKFLSFLNNSKSKKRARKMKKYFNNKTSIFYSEANIDGIS